MDRRVSHQIRNFQRVLEAFNNTEPLARFLAKFFKENKQMGSSDRRMTSRLCYNFFRLGNALPTLTPEERLVVAEFLCEQDSALVRHFQPSWESQMQSSVDAKIAFLQAEGLAVLEDVFPFLEEASAGLDKAAFIRSQFIQPDLFIRVKRSALSTVDDLLKAANIEFERTEPSVFRLGNGTKLQQVSGLEGLYEVQDLSSQKTADFVDVHAKSTWWDCCAASGGKALMLLDKEPKVELLVSDIRLSILRNLDERFAQAQVKQNYRKKVLDLTVDIDTLMDGELFDGILVDAPCSGSGTWGRTPEMIQQFSMAKLADFVELQQQIVSRVIPYLKPKGSLVYITCSVFKQENEAMLQYLTENFDLHVEESQLLAGYTQKADSMFIAKLRKNV